jgi:activating signal cointegrator 1
MKAISIWQPHASLIICGAKPFETRHWAAPKWLMWQRIAIHASKCTDDLEELAEYIQARKEDGDSEIFDSYEAMWKALIAGGFTNLNELPRGAIIGTAILSECIRSEDLADPGHFGNFGPGRFAWRMTDVKPLAEPIPFRGQQGFFNVDDAALAAQGKDGAA